ncbi:uncharacterized protein I206_106761 [Kwoniella pini CBS 10737]|uniref:Uncharacterized protein n=1 Tax=Kwoniella pini CBS 10737 TaxID=1296096 RepID=A0A1B9HTA7_9TREE|nr:uncharacterized protein I206_07351 [Kwoniella pini CBS 10737]OCF46498.1 hypothetical protein I206_07351 [Kwoniella pini CBS 10737]
MSVRLNMLRPTTSIIRNSLAVRGISTSTPKRASHDDSHHGHGEGAEDAYTTESFFTPFWRNTLILTTISILAYPYLPSTSTNTTSPSLDPETWSKSTKDNSLPVVTRLLAQITPKAEVWTQRNDKHLELSKEAAETKLLFQEAERPKVLRMRYPSSFEQASPHNIAVGSQADLTDLKVQL